MVLVLTAVSFITISQVFFSLFLGDVVELYHGDNRFTTVTDSGTATLKPRPRVRPLLTFTPLVSIFHSLSTFLNAEVKLHRWFQVKEACSAALANGV